MKSAMLPRFGAQLSACSNALLVLVLLAPLSLAQGSPILFAHGFCGTAFDFSALYEPLVNQLPAALYSDPTLYYVVYDSNVPETRFYILADGLLVPAENIDSSARFFTIIFNDADDESGGRIGVAQISILNKAYELSKVVKAITHVTGLTDVIVVGHSMGGLDARAYVENLASRGKCYNYDSKVPDYGLQSCNPGGGDAAFANDVADIITVDTPEDGTPLASLYFNPPYPSALLQFLECVVPTSVNKVELEPGSELLSALNYGAATLHGISPTQNSIPIQAVEDYFNDVLKAWDGLPGISDDVVPVLSQSITLNLHSQNSSAALIDLPVGYSPSSQQIHDTGDCWAFPYLAPILHSMECLGAQPPTQDAIASQANVHLASQTDVKFNGGTLSGTSDGLSGSGTVITEYTWGSVGVSGALGTVSFTTGPLIGGSLQLGGTFGAGGPVIVTTNGTDGTRNGTDLSGAFNGPVTWTLINLANGTHEYQLFGSFDAPDGVSGAMIVLTINTGQGYFNGSIIISSGDTDFVP